MTDKRYRIELEVLTPLHIGTGSENDWVRGADYAQKDGKVYVIDIKKAVEKGIDVSNLFVSNVQRSRKGIEEIDSKRLESIAKYIFVSPQSTRNDIKSCIRNQFLESPLVAGSSIKGAIRSALFKHLGSTYLKMQRGKQSKDSQLVKYVFGDMNKGTDYMRFIRITDVEIPKENNHPNNPGTVLVNTKLFNLQNNEPDKKWHGGWKNGLDHTERDFHSDQFNTLFECVEPGQKGQGAIILARSSHDLFEKYGLDSLIKKGEGPNYINEKKLLMGCDINELFKIINKATKKYLEEEETFFCKYDEADHTEQILESIRELKKLIPDENTDTGTYCLLKMSAGVGFHAITGNWVYDNFVETGTVNGKDDGKKNKKSRKIALYGGNSAKPFLTGYELMGFVRIRIVSEKDKEYDKLMKEANDLMKSGQWKDAYQKVKKAKSLVPSRNDHDHILEQCDKLQEAEDRKIEEQRILNSYNGYIHEAKELMNVNKWHEAKQKAESAEKLNVKKSDHHQIIQKCDKAIRFSKPLSEVIANSTSSVGNVIDTTKTWINYHPFGEKEYVVLRDALKEVKNLKEKCLRKERGGLSEAIGENMTNRLFIDLFPITPKVLKKRPQKDEVKQVTPIQESATEPNPIEISEQPVNIDISESHEESAEVEGIGSKISKWFKNLFK